MTPERYKQIGELYHAVLEVDAEERAAFLDRACANDDELRREVESLISSHEQSDDFIAAPAVAVAAELLAEREAHSLIGRMIARYRVLSLIGSGGMGRVYLAEDVRLGRRVALKLLPEFFTHEKNQVQRFHKEARAASALNHPNILTVYEVGDVEGTEFIATEYVDGETVRAKLSRSIFSLREALDITAQIADALAAAHAAGIVHRDIKPENLMLRIDGYVKVLDFGLAKLIENVGVRPESDGTTSTVIKTNPGIVMGTVQYMSPEQARGVAVDARTDVWSVGVILYEMITGRRPFDGPTSSDTIAAILEREPASLGRYMSSAPAELERIVTKALAKSVEARYQTIKDMAIDLRRLRQRLDVEAEIERSVNSSGQISTTSGGARAVETEAQAPTRWGANGKPHSTSSVEYLITQIGIHKQGAALVGVFLVILLSGAGYGLYRLVNRPVPKAPFQTFKMTRLTATGKVTDAAISPDGKHVVFTEEGNRQQSLWVRQVATGSSVQIVPPADVVYSGLTFSPDGNYVYYVKGTKDDQWWWLYQVPSLGGVSKKLIEHVDSAVTFSPDGSRFAFARAFPQKAESALVVVNIDGTGERTLATRNNPDFFLYEGIVRPAWSPDGKMIACAGGSTDEDGIYYNVVGVRVEDGTTTPLTDRRWGWVSQVAWLSGNGNLAIVAGDEEVSSHQLWLLTYPGGEARRITNDLNQYNDVSLTGSGNSLVTVQSSRASNIWVAPEGDARRAKQITSGTSDSSLGLAWTPDGQIVYQSDASGKSEIWIVNADGSGQRQLTHDGYNLRPVVSPDGRYIVFHSFRTGRSNIWRMDVDGGNARQVTNGKRNFFPDVSPDGRWLVYSSFDSGEITVWKVSIDGGEPIQLNKTVANLPVISPDGSHIASFYWDEKAKPMQGVMIFPFAGGQPTKRLNILPDAVNGFALHWSPDGRALLHFDDNLSNILSQPVDGGKPTQLTNFQGEQIFNFAWSHDGKWLALARGRVTDDVVLIGDVK